DREAVLEAVRAAGVLGDVAADRADLLRGGIRRVVEARVRNGARHVEIRDARLDDDLRALDVDLEDAGQPGERDDDPLGDGKRAAGEPGARAARDERNAVSVAGANRRLDVGRRLREHDERGLDAVASQSVALVRPQLLGFADQLLGAERALELAHEPGWQDPAHVTNPSTRAATAASGLRRGRSGRR